MFENVARNNEVIGSIETGMSLRNIQKWFAVIERIGVVEFLGE